MPGNIQTEALEGVRDKRLIGLPMYASVSALAIVDAPDLEVVGIR